MFLKVLEIDLQYVRYAGRKVGIPFEFDFFAGDNLGAGFALLTGVEAVPLTHRQKSGLFVQGLIGIIYASQFKEIVIHYYNPIVYEEEVVSSKAGFIANANVGYQLITKGGFVFNAAVGPMYSTITNKVVARISIDFGLAF